VLPHWLILNFYSEYIDKLQMAYFLGHFVIVTAV